MLPVKHLGWGTTLSKTHDMPKKARVTRAQSSPGPTPSVNVPVSGGMAWAAQLHAVMHQHAWAAAVQTPGGSAGQFGAHQALLVDLRAHQAGAVGGGVASDAAPTPGTSANETSAFGPAVDQGHKILAEMREERQGHPNMESVFRRTYSSPSALPSVANSTTKDADMNEEEICECVDCACVECAFGGLECRCREDNLSHSTLFCILHFVLCLVCTASSPSDMVLPGLRSWRNKYPRCGVI